jgi:hypothetical protein
MTNLSPAAQAVLEAAFTLADNLDRDVTEAEIIAAALQAAADRTMSLIGDVCHPKFMEGIEAASDFLEQIAAELEAQ